MECVNFQGSFEKQLSGAISSYLVSSAKDKLRRNFKCLAIALACMPVLVGVQTQAQMAPALQKQAAIAPSFAGPSMIELAKAAVFIGQGFKPNASVSIALRTPAGVESQFSAVVAADGSLSYRVQPQTAGVYSLTVLDSGGKTLASTNFNVMQ